MLIKTAENLVEALNKMLSGAEAVSVKVSELTSSLPTYLDYDVVAMIFPPAGHREL